MRVIEWRPRLTAVPLVSALLCVSVLSSRVFGDGGTPSSAASSVKDGCAKAGIDRARAISA